MNSKMAGIIFSGLFLFLMTNASVLHAADAGAKVSLGNYSWDEKLGRGLLNIVGSPVELARTINIQSRVKGPAYGWTMGLVEGLGRTFLRIGAGAIDTVTCPFEWPVDGRAPLVTPDYPWEKWDVDYL